MPKHSRCSVIGCKPSDRPGPFLHRLPVHEAQRLAWLQCIGRPATQKYARVCSRHFAPEDYIHDPRVQQEMRTVLRPLLRPGALPTLFVPNRTGETCTCSRAPLRCTASTQTTQDECSLPSASEAGTQTLAILRTAATQTPRHHSSGVQTDSCELSLPPATPERSADASASLWGLQAQASSTPVQRKLFGDADQIEEAEVNNLALLDDSYRPSAASQNCTNARIKTTTECFRSDGTLHLPYFTNSLKKCIKCCSFHVLENLTKNTTGTRTKRSSFGADDKGSYTMNCASLLDLKFFEQVQERFTRLKPEVARAMKATILKILDKAAKS
ncbi:uncharacterized protein [Dermacentor andersoni]|uniref:uncharacterized protein isoform X1 n=1 Tax=Dermacentor andersoni TaxID=34620 RepID=UPI00241702C5|nr:uncharacterized protein LOC126522712 isoform X3 [Dermacentor andersoni]